MCAYDFKNQPANRNADKAAFEDYFKNLSKEVKQAWKQKEIDAKATKQVCLSCSQIYLY